jgi:MOSC domain-containing protein YiiM
MSIELICVAARAGEPVVSVESLSLVAGKGIVGDRNYGRHKYPGQNLTLIEAEEIERFNREYHTAIALSATRRNLITRGVRLNQLVGREFRVGAVIVRGVELCEPCAGLGKQLAGERLSAAQVVKAFTHRCGLRTDILTSGVIHRGDVVVV